VLEVQKFLNAGMNKKEIQINDTLSLAAKEEEKYLT